jgi:Tfp pilus assembly protein PilF
VSDTEEAPRNSAPRAVFLLCAALFSLVALAFYPVLRNGFINLDDPSYVALNSHVQQGLSWESIKWAFTGLDSANWHPLTWLSHILDYQLFGERVWGHHLSSLVLHGVNTVALFLGLRALTGSLWRSFFVAAFFGVHPLRVESVAWVAERKDVLSTLFFILSLWEYAKYAKAEVRRPMCKVQSPKAEVESPNSAIRTPDGLWFYLGSLVLFGLGLMSKPMVVTLPLILLLVDFWPLRRFDFKNSIGGPRLRLHILVEKIPFFLLSIISCFVTVMAQRAGGIVVSSGGLALAGRAENALVSYCRYIGKLFWPANLAIFYPMPEHWPLPTVVGATVLLLAISGFAAWMWRRAPFLAVGWCWFVISLLPVIGLVQVGWQAMADRYSYIPSIGLLLMVVWGIRALADRLGTAPLESQPGRRWRVPLTVAGTVAILAFFFQTRQQLAYWKDGETLFRRTLAVTSNNAFTHNILGLALRLQGRLEESDLEMREAIRIKPDYAGAYRDLGYNQIMQNNLDEGIRSLETAVRLVPGLPKAHKQLGVAFQEQGKLDQALVQFKQEIKINPKDPESHNFAGAILLGLGRMDEAIPEFKTALRKNPGYAEAHSNFGIALCRQGNLAEGIAQFEASIQADPHYAEGHNNLAVALVRAGRRNEAISHFREVLKIRPNYPGAEQQLRALTNGP